MENGLVNGTNTYNNSGTITGSKWETTFESGKKYRFRIVNIAVDGRFQFNIDGHNLTVIANDFVPIVPYTTDSVLIAAGQRYDVIVEANAASDNYWLRAGWLSACTDNANADGITGIIRYDGDSTADPTTTGITLGSYCGDESPEDLVPYLEKDVGTIVSTSEEILDTSFGTYFTWTLNSSSFSIDWSNPTLSYIYKDNTSYPTDYNVLSVAPSSPTTEEWALMVIVDQSGFGLYHPIHLHGHDFYVVGSDNTTFDAATFQPNTTNPVRRDTASLPADGYLALAFKMDNPGVWLAHCHVAWHASEGFSLEFVESEGQIASTLDSSAQSSLQDTCSTWSSYTPLFAKEDAGV